jgi:hypothetical protein
MDFVEFMTSKLGEIGLAPSVSDQPNLITINAEVDGFSEPIYALPSGKTADGHTYVKLFSKAINFTGDEETDAGLAMILLRRNAGLDFSHWEAGVSEEEAMFIVSSTLIANTMDAPELSAAIISILSERRAMLKEVQNQAIDF